jgi:hypothetical protein
MMAQGATQSKPQELCARAAHMHDNEKGQCVQALHSMGESQTGQKRAKAAQQA